MRHEAHQYEIPGTAGLFNLSSEATDNGARTQAESDKAKADRAAAEAAQAQLHTEPTLRINRDGTLDEGIDGLAEAAINRRIAFDRLETAIAYWRDANRGNDRLRGVGAADFMLMNSPTCPDLQFKHRQTRNFVYLHASGTLTVPVLGVAFNRGDFGAEAEALDIEGGQA